MNPISPPEIQSKCYHCGESCEHEEIAYDEKAFCCQGCKLVYEVLSQNDLCEYYQLESNPGKSQKDNSILKNRFDYLDDAEVKQKLLDFKDEKDSRFD
jgi:Cu+-exporting ATPase